MNQHAPHRHDGHSPLPAALTDCASPALIDALQRSIPLVPRPFANLGEALGLTESEVLAGARALFDAGLARRLGGIFDAPRMGYRSVLCACEPLPAATEAIAKLCANQGVTHCYERDGTPSLWFTLTARQERLDAEIAAARSLLAPAPVAVLQADQRYKVAVIFSTHPAPSPSPPAAAPRPIGSAPAQATFAPSPADEILIRALQESLPIREEPFAEVAQAWGGEAAAVCERLRAWQARGILRRVALILHHRRAGFAANGLCLWSLPAAEADRAGPILARQEGVTHCYRRIPDPKAGAPWTLYAMVHGRDRAEAHRRHRTAAAAAGLPAETIFFSTVEHRKSSMRYV